MCMVAVQIAAMVVSAAMAVKAGNDANAAAKVTAANLERQGRMAADAGNSDATDIRNQGVRLVGTTTAQQANNGIDLNAGSALDVVGDTSRNVELDALRALYGGKVRQWDANYRAKIARYEGKVAQQNGYLQAFGTVLSSAAGMKFGGGTASAPVSGGTSASYAPSTGINKGITPFY